MTQIQAGYLLFIWVIESREQQFLQDMREGKREYHLTQTTRMRMKFVAIHQPLQQTLLYKPLKQKKLELKVST